MDDIASLGVGEIIKSGVLDGQTYSNLVLKLRQKFA